MPARITIACTHCGAKLNLSDESKLGKKFRCPKCSEVFIAESADDDEVFEDEDDEDEADEQPRPRRGAQAAAGGGKKGKGKAASSGGNLGLILGGVAGGVVLLSGLVGVLFATGVFGGTKPDPNQIQVSSQPGPGLFGALLKEQVAAAIPARTPVPEVAQWLPAESEFILHVRPADVLASPLVTDLLKSMQLDKPLNDVSASLGFQISDIESMTFGVAQLDKVRQQMQQAQMTLMTGGQPQFAGLNIPSIGVVKLKRSVTYDELIQLSAQISKDQPAQKVQYAGKEYLESTDPRTSIKSAAYLAGNSIVLLGESFQIKAAMEKGPHSKPARNFGFVDWTDHLTLAYAPQKPETLKQQLTAGVQANPMASMALTPLADGASGFSFGLTVKGGVEAEFAVGCLDTPKMDAVAKSLTDLSTMGRGQYDQNKSQLPPWASALTDLLMSNLKVTSSNRVVLVSTNIPDSAKDQLVQVPANIMATMAMNAMLGGPPNLADVDSELQTSPGDNDAPAADEAAMERPEADRPETESPEPERPQTEPSNVAAASAKGLPKGFELKGSLSDGFHAVEASQRALGFSLELSFVGKGEGAIAAVGQLQPGEGTTAEGEAIALAVPSSGTETDESGGWELMVNASADTGLASATVGTYELAVAADAAGPLASIHGSFRFVTGKKSKLIQIKDAKALVGQEADDPALKAAGLTIESGTMTDASGETEILTISVKEGYLLSKLRPTHAAGKLSYNTFTGPGPQVQVQILKPGVGSQELEEGVGFQAYLYSDLKAATVPFTFENVPLPQAQEETPQEKKPAREQIQERQPGREE